MSEIEKSLNLILKKVELSLSNDNFKDAEILIKSFEDLLQNIVFANDSYTFSSHVQKYLYQLRNLYETTIFLINFNLPFDTSVPRDIHTLMKT